MRRALTPALLFYTVLGLALNLIGPLMEPMREDFGLGYGQLATVLAALGGGYVIGSMAGGAMSDRLGRRSAAVGSLALAAMSLAVAAASPHPAILAATWALAGVGFGGTDGTVTALIADAAGKRAAAALNGAHLPFAAGAIAAPALVGGALAADLGWRPAIGLAAVLTAVVIWPFARLPAPSPTHRRPRLRESLQVVRAPVPLLLGTALAMYVGVEVGMSGFLAAFLERELEVARPLAATSVAVFWIGMFIGRGLGVWLADRWSAFRLAGLAVTFSTAFGLLVGLAPQVPLAVVAALGTGLAAGTVFPTLMAIGVRGDPGRAGAVAGIQIALAGIGGLLFPLVMGALADRASLRSAMLLVPALQPVGLVAIGAAWRLVHRAPPPSEGAVGRVTYTRDHGDGP